MDQIFEMQKSLNKIIGVDTDDISKDPKRQAEWIQNYCRALGQETAELLDSTPWKWWAKYQTMDVQNAKVEVIDLLHFVISAAQVLGLTAEDVFSVYQQKHQVNLNRQKSGYKTKEEDNKNIK